MGLLLNVLFFHRRRRQATVKDTFETETKDLADEGEYTVNIDKKMFDDMEKAYRAWQVSANEYHTALAQQKKSTAL